MEVEWSCQVPTEPQKQLRASSVHHTLTIDHTKSAMATQGLAATVVTVKLGSLNWSRSNSSSGGGAAALRLLSPAQPSLHALRACCCSPSSCSRSGAIAGRRRIASASASASTTSSPPVHSSSSAETTADEWPPVVPQEQVEAVRSLNGWVADNMLPLLAPVDSAWQPHDYLPRSSSGSDDFDAFTAELRDLRAAAACLPDELLVCLVGNMVTEEALPTYQSMGNRTAGLGDGTGASALPWARWMRGWAAEENRHGDLLNRYLYLTGRVDMRRVELTVHHLLRNGMEMLMPTSPYHSLIYGAFQERATFISHGHTARLAVRHGDRTLSRICGVVAADERRHEAAYTRVSAELFRVDPDGMVRALAHVMRGKVTMPGLLMSDGSEGEEEDGEGLFARFSAVAQRAGVYTASDYGDLVEHFVRRWRVADLGAGGLSGEGRRAQEYVCGLPTKMRRMEEMAQRRAAAREGPGMMARFSWIFNRAVVLG